MSRLIALGLIGHAVMHIGAVSCGLLFATSEPWLVTNGGIDAGLVDTSAILVTAVVVVAYVMAALAAIDIVVPQGWRGPLIAAGSIGSAIMLVALFSMLALPGLAIDALLLWAVFGRTGPSGIAFRSGKAAAR